MKAVAETLGVARSHLHDKVHRLVKPRGPYRKPDDDGLLELVRRLIDERPTYGYRRITALPNRERAKTGEPAVDHKRVFRIMRQNTMLLAVTRAAGPAASMTARSSSCARTGSSSVMPSLGREFAARMIELGNAVSSLSICLPISCSLFSRYSR
ncbi:IS3 family transposase [Mesorhizobium ciceri]|uniref:IS3 family transposase n=1 Tax=Mesorhizobium TaxID=68287 RepID=UPI0004BC4DEC|nr:IS3 family transposase [Mesorhizobium ciceri]